jgi:hypothetical protein
MVVAFTPAVFDKKYMLAAPAGIVTDAGTMSEGSLEDKETVTPPEPAGPVRVTRVSAVEPQATVFGSVTLETAALDTVRVPLA